MPVILVLERLKPEDHCELQACLQHTAKSCHTTKKQTNKQTNNPNKEWGRQSPVSGLCVLFWFAWVGLGCSNHQMMDTFLWTYLLCDNWLCDPHTQTDVLHSKGAWNPAMYYVSWMYVWQTHILLRLFNELWQSVSHASPMYSHLVVRFRLWSLGYFEKKKCILPALEVNWEKRKPNPNQTKTTPQTPVW